MSICIGKNATDASKRTVTIKTPQAEVEVTGFRHDKPGVCPYCHKKIPLRTVIFKKVDTNGNTGTFTSAVLAGELGITMDKDTADDLQDSKPRECPFCHKQILTNEIIFKEKK